MSAEDDLPEEDYNDRNITTNDNREPDNNKNLNRQNNFIDRSYENAKPYKTVTSRSQLQKIDSAKDYTQNSIPSQNITNSNQNIVSVHPMNTEKKKNYKPKKLKKVKSIITKGKNIIKKQQQCSPYQLIYVPYCCGNHFLKNIPCFKDFEDCFQSKFLRLYSIPCKNNYYKCGNLKNNSESIINFKNKKKNIQKVNKLWVIS